MPDSKAPSAVQDTTETPEHPLQAMSTSVLYRVGAQTAKDLKRLGVTCVLDLLHHYPARWVDRRQITPIMNFSFADTKAKEIGEDGKSRKKIFTVKGTVAEISTVGGQSSFRFAKGRRKIPNRLQIILQDDTGRIGLVFFGQAWRKNQIQEGDTIVASGPLSYYNNGFQFSSPEFEVLGEQDQRFWNEGGLLPVYPLTKGITQRLMRVWMNQAMEHLARHPIEILPQDMLETHQLQGLTPALRNYHFPASPDARDQARKRLAFDEFFLDQLFMGTMRRRRETNVHGKPCRTDGPIQAAIRGGLPFELTSGQDSSLKEILSDMAGKRPMNRLLQGDVGSGKTVVALLAAGAAADTGVQTAFMAPTEILAEQHLHSLREFALPHGMEPRLLTGSTPSAARKEILRSLADGTCPLVVGTHALFSEGVRFNNLGLAVVDEQHRFGVMQRLALWEKGSAPPHVLVMSATPIPRSLALVRYADLDLSIIRERPAGRGKIISRVSTPDKRDKLYEFMAERLAEGRQAYVVYPLVEESDKMDLQAATVMAETLAARSEFKAFQVDLLHGQMKPEEKERIMRRFQEGESQILVATTVVEVGIDVPNAVFMVIEHPERYGLSQLHQLRGRVGRGEHTSYCVLVSSISKDARGRLKRFSQTDDGFEVARMDLEYRGQGDLLGTRQSGRPGYRLADPVADEAMLDDARNAALEILESGVLDGGAQEWLPLRQWLSSSLQSLGVLTDVG